MLNELSSTVVFERPTEEAFIRKWQLACEGDIAHVVVRPAALPAFIAVAPVVGHHPRQRQGGCS